MRQTCLRALLMIVFGVFASRGTALADDVSDVRTAADRFARELYDGDSQAAKKDAALGDEGSRWLDAIGSTAKAANRLRRLGEARFGPEGGKIFSIGALGLELEGAEI